MSKIIPHSANGINWLLVEVPEDATGFLVMKNSLRWKTSPNKYWWDQLIIPSEGWEIVGKADQLSEDQRKDIIDRYTPYAWGTRRGLPRYVNYDKEGLGPLDSDSDSFLSLLLSHGLKISETLILKSTQLLNT